MTLFIIIITALTFLSSLGNPVSAVSPSPSPKTSNPSVTTIIDKLKQIEVLKEKIATKVAELRQNEKSGVWGTVQSVKDTTITLSSETSQKEISYSEDTIFFKMKDGQKGEPLDAKKAMKLKNGDQIAVLGYFDSSHSNFSAKYIYIEGKPVPLRLLGKIADIDKTNYTVTVNTLSDNTLVDIETYTKIYTYNKNTGLAKAGFSRLKQGDTVHIFATAGDQEEGRVSADKLISLTFGINPTVSPTVTVKTSSPSPQPTVK